MEEEKIINTETINSVDNQKEEVELSKEEQYEQWVQLATIDIFGKAIYFDKNMKVLLNDIASKTIKCSKLNE